MPGTRMPLQQHFEPEFALSTIDYPRVFEKVGVLERGLFLHTFDGGNVAPTASQSLATASPLTPMYLYRQSSL